MTTETVDLSEAFAPSATGTNYGYQVQARYIGTEGVKQVGDLILCQKWKNVPFRRPSPIGVPSARDFEWYLLATDCMNYEAAEALRWWFLATCVSESFGGRLCVETRIIRFKIDYSFAGKADAVMEQDKDAWRKGTI